MTEDEVFEIARDHSRRLAKEAADLIGPKNQTLMRTYWLRIAQGSLSAGYLMAREAMGDEGAERWIEEVFRAFFYDVKALGGPALRLKIEEAEAGETFTGE
jgi:hypothetical protein